MPTDYLTNPPLGDDEMMAAIDIGSNSFHLAIARLDHGEVRKVVSMSEKVQLAAGLDERNILSAAAEQRGNLSLKDRRYDRRTKKPAS